MLVTATLPDSCGTWGVDDECLVFKGHFDDETTTAAAIKLRGDAEWGIRRVWLHVTPAPAWSDYGSLYHLAEPGTRGAGRFTIADPIP